MAASLKTNILPTADSIQDSAVKSHRRQASHGLEINTSSKTNAFFHTADIPTPRPPPSISRKISIKQHHTNTINSISPPSPSILTSKLEEEDENDDEIYHHASYASRLRNLVASTRQSLVAPAPSPIPQHLHAKKNLHSPLSPLSSCFEEGNMMVDEILSLPTPHPTTASIVKPRHFIFPISTTGATNSSQQQIPVISHDILQASISNEIPRLSENLKLGDDKDILIMGHTASRIQDLDLVGKQIGLYRIIKLLGVGAFSHVYLASHVESGQLFAVKAIQKGKLLDDPRVRSSIEREVGVLKFIDHSNIVHLEATIETEQLMCIILEYVEGGELFEFVQKMHQQLRMSQNSKIDETLVKPIFLQLVHAVKWLHGHNIVHRDLKLENILIHKSKDTNQVVLKITDFGLARVVDPESPLLTTRCGSEEYAAPEIIQQSKDGYDGRKTDTWSLGIILYALLVGYLPFRYDARKNERVSQLFYRIVRAEVKWPKDTQLSQQAKDVVKAILDPNPDRRIAIDQIEDLPWFSCA
ncbi:kinase-like domain-containing protein [Helicostylum pulchrum]|nr:kinase-like domain-containing protein [Helicostylum pulchrum]